MKQTINDGWYYSVIVLYFLSYAINSFVKDCIFMIFATGIFIGALIWHKE